MCIAISHHLITASHFAQVPAMIIIYLLHQQTADFFLFFLTPTYKTPICGLTTVKCQHGALDMAYSPKSPFPSKLSIILNFTTSIHPFSIPPPPPFRAAGVCWNLSQLVMRRWQGSRFIAGHFTTFVNLMNRKTRKTQLLQLFRELAGHLNWTIRGEGLYFGEVTMNSVVTLQDRGEPPRRFQGTKPVW